jgi:hypothetical protein
MIPSPGVGEWWEHPPTGWVGCVERVEEAVAGLLMARLVGEDGSTQYVGTGTMLCTWRRRTDTLRAAAERGGWIYYDSLDDAVARRRT